MESGRNLVIYVTNKPTFSVKLCKLNKKKHMLVWNRKKFSGVEMSESSHAKRVCNKYFVVLLTSAI